MEIIQDGKGRAHRAGVTDEGHLETTAITESRFLYNSRFKKSAYEFHPPTMNITAGGGIGGVIPMVWMKNISTDKFWYMNNIRISFNGGNTTKLADCSYNIYIGMGTPTTNTTTGRFGVGDGPHNLNLSSQIEAPIDFRFWDGTGTNGMGLTNSELGQQLTCGLIAKGTINLTYDGALVIPPSYVVGFTLNTQETGRGGFVVNGWVGDDQNH